MKNFEYLGLKKDFENLMNSLELQDYSIDVVKRILGEPRTPKEVEAGPTFPYPNEYTTELLVKVIK